MRLSTLSVSLLALGFDAHALRFPVVGRRSLARRGNVYGVSTLKSSNDFRYYTTLTLGGKTFTKVIIDTGSADLWIAGSVPDANSTNIVAEVQYVVGAVKGPIKTATLEFANHTIQNQAFLEIMPSSDNPEDTGLIGLGPNSNSNIFRALNGALAGAAPIDRIFRENTSTPNFITVLLGRSNDPTDTFPGDVTVSEVVTGFEDILNQPKLNCTQVSAGSNGGQHWQALLDLDGIEVNGTAIDLPDTVVNGTQNPKQLTAMFDTGFTVPQVPKSVADAIYSGISGAKMQNISNIGNVWTFGCDIEVNVTFKFGGKSIPIHPLDASLYANGTTSSDGERVCFGGFQPNTASANTYDMILGMAFLRNAYMLINYGDFVEGSPKTTADPYIQLLALTNDTTEAHQDFLRVRNAASSGGSKFKTSLLVTILAIAAGLILLFGTLFALMRHFRNRRARGAQGASVNRPWGAATAGAYYPLGAPAPQAAAEVHHDSAQRMPYGAPYQQPHDAPGRAPLGGEADSYYNPSGQHGQSGYSNPFDDRR